MKKQNVVSYLEDIMTDIMINNEILDIEDAEEKVEALKIAIKEVGAVG